MKRAFAVSVLLALLCVAGPLVAQVPPPVDGTPATAGATTTTTQTAVPPPVTAPAAPGTTIPLPVPPGGPGVITIVISPELLQWIIQALTAVGQPGAPGAPGAPGLPGLPGLPPLPPIGQLPGPGVTPPPPGGGAYTPKKNEKPLPGFPLLVVKGKKLIRTGPGLAQAMAFIQAGDQPNAVNVLAQTLSQVQAAAAQNPKLKPGKQAAATQSAYQIGVQTMPPGLAPAGPTSTTPGPTAPTDTTTVTATPTNNETSTIPPVANGQGGPPPEPLPPGQIPPVPGQLPPTPDKPLPIPGQLPPGLPPAPPKGQCNPAFANAVAGAQKQASPIVLDLNGNGVADVTSPDVSGNTGAFNPVGAVRFDLTGQGGTMKFEWLKPEADGLLVLDSNGNGTVDNSTELFGDSEGFNDGFSKLALLDRNSDGKLDGAELSHLAVWVDDGDGSCEPGELKSLSSLDITQIDVRHKNYVSSFVRGGKTFSTWDWFPRSE